MNLPHPARQRELQLVDLTAFLLLLATVTIVTLPPVFPSQDGPLHLYFVDVLRGVLTHTAPYSGYFEIRSYLTPYSLEHYSLLLLELVFSPTLSEKVLISIYVLAFGGGFRFLVLSLNREGHYWTLAALPFAMNSLVYLGFMNYCLGVALALFSAGMWVRLVQAPIRRNMLGMGGLFLAMLLNHPVTTALFLLFAGLHLVEEILATLVHQKIPLAKALEERKRVIGLLAGMGMAAVIWVAVHYDPPANGVVKPSLVEEMGWRGAIKHELTLWPMVPFGELSYRYGETALLAVATIGIGLGLWRVRGLISPAACALVATSGICFLLFAAVPGAVNGSSFFAVRFPIFWVLFLLAGAAAAEPPRLWSRVAGVIGVGVTFLVLTHQWTYTERIARELEPALTLRPAEAGLTGLVVGDEKPHMYGLGFDPFLWGSVHYFRRSGAILANAPWMEIPILMVRPARPDRWSYLDPYREQVALWSALQQGVPITDIDFYVRQGPESELLAKLKERVGWPAVPGTERGAFTIYKRKR